MRTARVLSLALFAVTAVACSKREAGPSAATSNPASPTPAAIREKSMTPTDLPAPDPAAAATATAPMAAASVAPLLGSRDVADEELALPKASEVRAPVAPGRMGGARAAGPMGGAIGDGLGFDRQFQGVRAGEWDDNANYREFQRFLGATIAPFHRLDIRARRFLVVRDRDGKPMPRCTVTVSDREQKSVSFVTTASGRAMFFPFAEEFGTKDFTATARCREGSVTTPFSLNQDDDGIVDLKLAAVRQPLVKRAIDVAFVLDTTGSMSEEIAAVKHTIQRALASLDDRELTVRVGLVEYKDKGDDFVTKVYPMTTDMPALGRKVSGIQASGGGDMPEHMTAGLHAALSDLAWSDDSVARLAFVVADAPPHLDYEDGLEYTRETRNAAHKGIQLFTVAASGMDELGQVVFRQMAQYTGGTEMFVLRGGDPKRSCGGTHENYASGNLHELVVQKIKRELANVDGDPMQIAGLKTDENAKPCEQRLVFAQ